MGIDKHTPEQARTLVRLQDKHPVLFMLLLVKAAVMVVLIYFLIFQPELAVSFNKPVENPLPLAFWAIPFGINTVMFIIGAFSKNGGYKWARRGLVFGSIMGGYWAAGFWFALYAGTVIGVSAPLLWTLYCVNCVILSREPAINPVSSVIAYRDKTNGGY